MACTEQNPIETEKAEYAGNTAHASISVKIEFAIASDQISTSIRDNLINVLAKQVSPTIESFAGDKSDIDAIAEYFGSKELETMSKDADDDFNYRAEYLKDDEDLTDEEIAERLDGIPGWETDINISKYYETDHLVVFQSGSYYHLGGAHGEGSGEGALTYSKKDGSLFTNFMKKDCIEDFQSLIINGLLSYFFEDGNISPEGLGGCLFDSEGPIPLPKDSPYPNTEGLCFCYQQYEIAPYSYGTPEFIISYEEIKPFLTDEAIELLGI